MARCLLCQAHRTVLGRGLCVRAGAPKPKHPQMEALRECPEPVAAAPTGRLGVSSRPQTALPLLRGPPAASTVHRACQGHAAPHDTGCVKASSRLCKDLFHKRLFITSPTRCSTTRTPGTSHSLAGPGSTALLTGFSQPTNTPRASERKSKVAVSRGIILQLLRISLLRSLKRKS